MAQNFFNKILEHSQNKISKLKSDIHNYKDPQEQSKIMQNNRKSSSQILIEQSKQVSKNKKSYLNSKSTLQSTSQDTKNDIDAQLKKTEQRRRALLSQLKQIDIRLSLMKKQKEIAIKKSEQMDQKYLIQKTQKALELVRKMNKQRKQKQLRKLKQNQTKMKQLDKSLQQIEEMKKKQQLQKLQKRKLIEQKIMKSKQKYQAINLLNRQSNKTIKQINQPQKIFDITQIQQDSSKLPTISQKKYPKSLFLKKLQQQEKYKKLHQQIKQREKYLINDKRKSYNFLLKPLPHISPKFAKQQISRYQAPKDFKATSQQANYKSSLQ